MSFIYDFIFLSKEKPEVIVNTHAFLKKLSYSKSFKFNFLNFGEIFPVTATTNKVNEPPTTIAAFVPHHLAVNPDSNAPISLEEPMKIPFTAETRPRMLSGVASCNIE
jgi:hypothetical protein